VSLWDLSKERRVHLVRLKQQLAGAGFLPALDRESVGACFYMRDAVQAFLLMDNNN